MARRPLSPKKILTACEMVFNGNTYEEVAHKMGVSKHAISRMSKTELWLEFEGELIAATKAEILNGESDRAFQEG